MDIVSFELQNMLDGDQKNSWQLY